MPNHPQTMPQSRCHLALLQSSPLDASSDLHAPPGTSPTSPTPTQSPRIPSARPESLRCETQALGSTHVGSSRQTRFLLGFLVASSLFRTHPRTIPGKCFPVALPPSSPLD